MAYRPTPIPQRGLPRNLRLWLATEFQLIANALANVDNVTLTPLASEPERLTDGMIVYANGTDWNPGSGAGVYARQAGAWVKL